jgi:hypothetical protein
MGVGLALLEVGAPRGWAAGLAALVSFIPLALALALGGPAAAGLAAGAGAGLAGVLGGAPVALVVLLRHALPGLVLGWTLVRRVPLPAALALVTLASALGLALLVVLLVPAGGTPLAVLERQLEAQVGELERLPGRLGAGGEEAWTADAARAVAGVMRVAGPGVVAVGLFLGALANYVGARLGYRQAGFRPFARETVPDHLVWGVIGAGVLLVTGSDAAVRLGVNLLVLLLPLYALQGLAVVRHFFQRGGVPRPLQVLGFGLFALQPVLLLGAAGVGLSDLWIDFRKIRQVPSAA